MLYRITQSSFCFDQTMNEIGACRKRAESRKEITKWNFSKAVEIKFVKFVRPNQRFMKFVKIWTDIRHSREQ